MVLARGMVHGGERGKCKGEGKSKGTGVVGVVEVVEVKWLGRGGWGW